MAGPSMITRLVFVLLVLGATTTFAQPPIEQAKKLHEAATGDYTLGHFDKALVGYEAAYKLYPAPAFLFNIAQCHFQLQHWERAVFFFEGYLREVPDAPNRQLVEELIKDANTRRAEQRDTDARKLDLEKQRLELEKKEKEREERRRQQLLASQKLETPPESPVYKKWWFWSIVGGAAVGVTTTLVLTSGKTVLPGGSLGTLDQR
jgi:tetratricopeptide (TPR) repeat protein